jgi:hypothetical protein
MKKDSKALKTLIEKAERETQELLIDVAAGTIDRRTLETGLQQVGKDLIQIHVFNHKADSDDDSDVDPK